MPIISGNLICDYVTSVNIATFNNISYNDCCFITGAPGPTPPGGSALAPYTIYKYYYPGKFIALVNRNIGQRFIICANDNFYPLIGGTTNIVSANRYEIATITAIPPGLPPTFTFVDPTDKTHIYCNNYNSDFAENGRAYVYDGDDNRWYYDRWFLYNSVDNVLRFDYTQYGCEPLINFSGYEFQTTGGILNLNNVDISRIVAGPSGFLKHNKTWWLIGDADIAADTISGTKLITNTLSGAKIIDGTITGAKIASATITLGKMAANSVAGSNITDYAVVFRHMDINSVGTDALIDLSVSSGKLSTNSVTNLKIANGAVTYNK